MQNSLLTPRIVRFEEYKNLYYIPSLTLRECILSPSSFGSEYLDIDGTKYIAKTIPAAKSFIILIRIEL